MTLLTWTLHACAIMLCIWGPHLSHAFRFISARSSFHQSTRDLVSVFDHQCLGFQLLSLHFQNLTSKMPLSLENDKNKKGNLPRRFVQTKGNEINNFLLSHQLSFGFFDSGTIVKRADSATTSTFHY